MRLAACLLAFFAACAFAQVQPIKPPQFGQAGKDVVWLPLPDKQVEKLLDMANVTPADFVMDLGSGDGRLVIAAARRGAHAVGVEFNPDLVSYSRSAAAKAGVADKAEFVQGDLFAADLSRASVITLFLLESMNIKLRPALLGLKPGARVVANTFGLGDWQPDAIEHYPQDCDAWCAHYLWIVPARIEGLWHAPEGDLSLSQQYQKLSGSLGRGALSLPLAGSVTGAAIRFKAGGAEYNGSVRGSTIEGTVVTGSALRPWKAQRSD